MGKKGEDAVNGTLKITEFGHEAIDGLSEYEVSDADRFAAGRSITILAAPLACPSRLLHSLHESSYVDVRDLRNSRIPEPSSEIVIQIVL